MHQKNLFILKSRICRLHFEKRESTWYIFCTMRYEWRHNTSCIVYWEKLVYYVISFREGWYGFRKPQCGDPEHRIKLCEINSIKNDNIDGYIINSRMLFQNFILYFCSQSIYNVHRIFFFIFQWCFIKLLVFHCFNFFFSSKFNVLI